VGHLVRELSGAIRRAIIDHEDFDGGILLKDQGNESRKILAFVVCRDDYECARHALYRLVEALEIGKKQAYVAKNWKIGASHPDDK